MTHNTSDSIGVCASTLRTESDEDFRTRLAQKYGMWGALLTTISESSGKALDDCGKHLGVTRIVVDIPTGPCSGSCNEPPA